MKIKFIVAMSTTLALVGCGQIEVPVTQQVQLPESFEIKAPRGSLKNGITAAMPDIKIDANTFQQLSPLIPKKPIILEPSNGIQANPIPKQQLHEPKQDVETSSTEQAEPSQHGHGTTPWTQPPNVAGTNGWVNGANGDQWLHEADQIGTPEGAKDAKGNKNDSTPSNTKGSFENDYLSYATDLDQDESDRMTDHYDAGYNWNSHQEYAQKYDGGYDWSLDSNSSTP